MRQIVDGNIFNGLHLYNRLQSTLPDFSLLPVCLVKYTIIIQRVFSRSIDQQLLFHRKCTFHCNRLQSS
jgi:hypothetical protein